MPLMIKKINKTEAGPEKWAATGGLMGGFGAFIGASCCVLPLILFNLGVSSAVIAQLGFFARFRDIFLFVALGLIAAGVFLVFRAGKIPATRTLFMLGGGLLLVAIAYILPFFEQDLLIFLGFRGG